MSRKSKGAALVQAVAGLWLLVFGALLGALLLLNVGGATYDYEKINFVAEQAAMYATTFQTGDASRQSKVEAMVLKLIQSMGFNSANTRVTISDTTNGGQPAVQVTVTTSLATLLTGQFGSIFPSEITMPCQCTSVKNIWFNAYCVTTLLSDPKELAQFNVTAPPGNGGKITCPVVDANLDFPRDGLPHYRTNIFGTSNIN